MLCLICKKIVPRLNCKSCPCVGPHLLLLTGSLLVKWCLDNSISASVTTPLSTVDLATVLVSALESNTAQPDLLAPDIIYDILLAEDNVVNQKVAMKMLEKYGHKVTIVENGHQAVEAVKGNISRGQPFDVVLVRVYIPFPHDVDSHYLLDGCFNALDGRQRSH